MSSTSLLLCLLLYTISFQCCYLAVAKAVHNINRVVQLNDDDDEQVLLALKSPEAAIRSVTDECVGTYREKLAAAWSKKQEELGE